MSDDSRLTVDPATDLPKSVRVDSSGIVLSWKVAGAIFALFVGSGAVWTTLGLAKLDDLDDHNKQPTAHNVLRETLSIQIDTRFEELNTLVRKQGENIAAIQDSAYNDRADRLADKAASRIRNSKTADDIRQSVRRKALYNLRSGKPIDDGIDRELLY